MAERASDEDTVGDTDAGDVGNGGGSPEGGRGPGTGATPERRAPRATAAAAAAAAMDELDASEGFAVREDAGIEEILARYRELPPVSEQRLVAHVRGGVRIDDGKTHQLWDWTNADVCRVVRPLLERRFADLRAHRELAKDMGFDDEGNRVVAEGGSDRIVARAGDRFNDIYRETSGVRQYGSGRGLLLAEAQLLRTRYWRLETEEVVEGRRAEDRRRYAAQVSAFLLAVLLFAGLMVLVLSL